MKKVIPQATDLPSSRQHSSDRRSLRQEWGEWHLQTVYWTVSLLFHSSQQKDNDGANERRSTVDRVSEADVRIGQSGTSETEHMFSALSKKADIKR
jgi:hypothetical protein